MLMAGGVGMSERAPKARAPNIGAEYKIVVYDEDGKERRRFGGEAKCFVKGFMTYLYHLSRNGTQTAVLPILATTFTDIGGTDRTTRLNGNDPGRDYHVGGARANGGVGDVARGIVVGRGTDPVTLEDYSVDGMVSGNTLKPDLEYSANVFAPLEFDGNRADIVISRAISNNSGNAVNGISSIALYVRGTNTNFSFMVLRDVIPSVDLGPGEIVAVEYRLVFNRES